jgi:hypothetical protein
LQGYPTVKYFIGGSPEDYKGQRDFDTLKAFVESDLMVSACDSNNKGECDADSLAKLQEAEKLTVRHPIAKTLVAFKLSQVTLRSRSQADERAAKIEEINAAVKATEKAHADLLEKLQAEYTADKTKTEAAVAELKKGLKWLKAVKSPKDGKAEL